MAALLAAGRPGRSNGAVYFVALDGDDRNPGAPAQPWRHIEWALTRPFLQPGDTIRIRGGIYRPAPEANSSADDALIRPVASGEPGRPITVMSEPGQTVVLSGRLHAVGWETAGANIYYYDYPAPGGYPFDHPFQVVEDGRLLYRVSSRQGVDRPGRCYVDTAARRLWVWTTDGRPPGEHAMEYGVTASGVEFRNGVQHWRLAGFALTGFRTSGVLIAGRAGRIELDRMDIGYIGAHRPGADPTNGWAWTVQDTVGGNYVHDSRLHHTLAEAVHISQTGAGGDLYENNDIREAGGAQWLHEGNTGRVLTGPGLILRGDGVTVRGNRFHANGYHGLILESDLYGSEGRSSPSRNLIEGNVFSYNAGNGLYGDGKNGLEAGAGNIVRFNLFVRNNQARQGSDWEGELRLGGNLDDTWIHNNTFHAEHANGVFVFSGRVADGSAQGEDAVPNRLRLANNIVIHTGRLRRTWPLRAVLAPGDLGSECNDWYRSEPGPLVEWNGAEFSSLEGFRARTGLERRGLSVDPRLVSPENGNFWLRAVSPVIGWGLSDSGMAPDLGAFPYRPLLELQPLELRFAAVAGGRDPAPQWIAVKSAAGIPLGWGARASGERWLQLSAAAGEAPGRLGVVVRTGDQTAGSHTATVQVAPALEGEPPLAVRVVFTVVPAPARRRR